jgi:cytochrome c
MMTVIVMGCSDDTNKLASETPVASFDDIVQRSNCLACHSQGNGLGLPTWSAISKKYADKKNMEAKLVYKISHGGSGSWGNTDMPPFSELSSSELEVLAHGILASTKNNK